MRFVIGQGTQQIHLWPSRKPHRLAVRVGAETIKVHDVMPMVGTINPAKIESIKKLDFRRLQTHTMKRYPLVCYITELDLLL